MMDATTMRALAVSLPAGRTSLGVVGDTYTTILGGPDTNGRFALLYMLVPPGSGPSPHKHAFEEAFLVLEGEIEAVCGRDRVRAGPQDAVNVPAGAPHAFRNVGSSPARLLCVAAPAGLEEFFAAFGDRLPGPEAPAPRLSAEELAACQPTIEVTAREHGITLLPPDFFGPAPKS